MNSHKHHDDLVSSVADRYRREGYDVHANPQPGSLPFDLGGYQPDLVARKAGQSLIVEVKTQPGKTSFERLRAIVDEVRRHEGWQFVLVTAQDIGNGLPSDGDEPFSWDDLNLRVSRARRLVNEGEPEAAYIVLWITFERALRFQARQISLPVDQLRPDILVGELYSHGELTMAQYDAARACQVIRNRIVHGLPAQDLNIAVARLTSLLRDVADQWRSPVPGGR